MAHVDVTRHEHGLHGFGQVEQTQQIAGRAARAAHGLRGLLVREAKLANQALQALGFFQRVQVFTLDVLDQRHGRSGLVGHLAHQHRHFRQPSQARGAEAPLARDDFVLARVHALSQAAHQDGLHDALGLDALGQFVQRALVHARARLVHAGHHVVQAPAAGQPRIGGLRLLCRFERAQALASDWGARFIDAGERGHINAESGLGAWSDGMELLQSLLKD